MPRMLREISILTAKISRKILIRAARIPHAAHKIMQILRLSKIPIAIKISAAVHEAKMTAQVRAWNF